MTWTKLDDQFWSNRKVRAAGRSIAVYTRCLTWCSSELTDGRIPADDLEFICSGIDDADVDAEHLVAVGLFVADGDDYVIPNYLEFNQSRSEVEEKREKDRARKRSGGQKPRPAKAQAPSTESHQTPENLREDSAGTPLGTISDSVTPDPTRPDPSIDQNTRSSDDEPVRPKPASTPRTFPDDFDAFWDRYPRKVSKKAARGRYDVVRRNGTTAEQLLNGVTFYQRHEWRGREPQHIPHAATWLNQFDPSELDTTAPPGRGLRSVPDDEPTHPCWVPEGLTECVVCHQVPKEATA